MAISKQDKIVFLEHMIKRERAQYYNRPDKKVISDPSYDSLEEELRGLDPNNPLLSQVGAPIDQEEWVKAKHKIPLGSLDKVKLPEELLKWAMSDVNGVPVFQPHNSFLVTEKLDGLSIEVIYDNGRLAQAITRGDGVEGYDITPNVARMNGVHNKLPTTFSGSLRGEIILRKSVFEKHFKESGYSNTRNAAGGISKRLDGAGCEYLNILFYQVVGNVVFATEKEQFQFLEHTLKLQVPNYTVSTGSSVEGHVECTSKIWEEYQSSIREQLDWDLDGLVVRINELQDQLALGDLHLRPYGATAFKFKAESARTKVLAIQLQVGNSGRITPVLEVEPVHLVGAEINRASLYNFGYISQIGLDVGATVLIIRANDVIPRCEVVLEPTGTIFQTPTECPVCGAEVVMNGENLHCTNTDKCPAQVVGRLKNWINTLGILEWGDKLLERVVEYKLVQTVPDLYKLSVDDLCKIERMGTKSATKCYNILHAHKTIGVDELLGGLSIPMVGTSTIQMLVSGGLETLDAIMNASHDAIVQIKGIGPVKAQCIHDGLVSNAHIIAELLRVGVNIKERQPTEQISNKLTDKVICITGSTKVKRDDLIKIIKDNGGQFKDSVSKGCTHLMLADPSKVSTKTKNAQKLGIQIISEDDFFKIIS